MSAEKSEHEAHLMSSTLPSATRLTLVPSPLIVASGRPVLVPHRGQCVIPGRGREPHWVVWGRKVYRWLEHPVRQTARIVKFAAIVVCCYALLMLVLL